MRKRQTFKGHSFSLRVPEKVRYGLDLLARKHHVQMSALVMRAIDKMFEDEGLNRREPGQLLSLMDKLWSDSESERIYLLQQHAPELMTREEQTMRAVLDVIKVAYGQEEVEELLKRHNLLDELANVRTSKTFADEAIKANPNFRDGDFKNTEELLKLAKKWAWVEPDWEELDRQADLDRQSKEPSK